MCIALPMRVLEVDRDKNTATVSFSGNELVVNAGLVSPQVGDFVLVHAGCAIEIVQKKAADEILDILSELEDITR